MTETTNTAARSTRANPRYISMYVARDAALKIRNRPNRRTAAAASTRFPRQRRLELGNSLLRTALAHQTETASVDWQIGRAANGGPVIRQGPDTQPAPRISLSHSGEYIAAGVCNAASIGVDIERQSARRFAAIAAHLDWPRATWDRPGSLEANQFYHLWTLWEAAIKSCPAESVEPAKLIFERIVANLTIGAPGAAPARGRFAASWRCADHFWLSIIASHAEAPDIRLFLIDRLESAPQATQITEITSDDGRLDSEIFR